MISGFTIPSIIATWATIKNPPIRIKCIFAFSSSVLLSKIIPSSISAIGNKKITPLKFAVNCKKYIDDVALSVVDIIGEEEVNKCKELCNKYDLKLKVRQFR